MTAEAKLQHAALCCPDEADADRFFVALLGFTRSARKTVPAAVMGPLFGVDEDVDVINYASDGARFEVFLREEPQSCGRIAHTCLEVADVRALVARARELGFGAIEVPKGDKVVTFLSDAAGNQFEIVRG